MWAFAAADASSALGPALYACGDFTAAGGAPAHHVARWDGEAWSALEDAYGEGLDGNCIGLALGRLNGDAHDMLYVVGTFDEAGGRPAPLLARWDGTTWSALPFGLVRQDLTEPFAYGVHLARAGEFAAAPTLLIGGSFSHFSDGSPAQGVVAYDGSSWSSLANPGLVTNGATFVEAILPFDDGNGLDLYFAGNFEGPGPQHARNVARYAGGTYAALDQGVYTPGGFGPGSSLAVYGGDLHVSGNFSTAGAIAVGAVARWDGSTWHDLDGGMDAGVERLLVADVGDGAQLYASGFQTHAGGIGARLIARWDGNTWRSLMEGLGPTGGIFDHAMAMTQWDDGGGPCLYVGGVFTFAGGYESNSIARWCCREPERFQRRSVNDSVAGYDFGVLLLGEEIEFGDDYADGLPERVTCSGHTVPLQHGRTTEVCGALVVVGTPGPDRLLLGRSLLPGVVFGGPGDDVIVGGPQDDFLSGGSGRDWIDGGGGDDQVLGGIGNDVLRGGAGDDAIGGEAGDDDLVGGIGRDLLDGGAGRDRAVIDERGDELRNVERRRRPRLWRN